MKELGRDFIQERVFHACKHENMSLILNSLERSGVIVFVGFMLLTMQSTSLSEFQTGEGGYVTSNK